MTTERQPYFVTNDIGGVWLMHVPVLESDPEIRAFYAKIGIRRAVGMTTTGSTTFKDIADNSLHYVSWSIYRHTAYTEALDTMQYAKNHDALPAGSHEAAFMAVVSDELSMMQDASWLSYFPRQLLQE